jgi:hypothetical protein
MRFGAAAGFSSPKVAFSLREHEAQNFYEVNRRFELAEGFRAERRGSGESREEVVAMKSFGLFLTVAAVGGMLAAAAPKACAQNDTDHAGSAEARMIAACQVVSEATRVQEALDRFDSALAAHDVDQLQAAGIEPVSAKGWQRFFKSNPDAKVTDSCPVTTLFIGGDTAIWNCRETSTITSSGKPMQYARMIQFTFTKKDGAWTISDRK